MKSLITIGAILVVSGGLLDAQAPNQSPASQQPASKGASHTNGDQSFVKTVAADGMAEVELGTLASQKGTDDKVKAFGQRMVADHGKAGDELKSIASAKQIALPAAIDAKHQAAHDRLAKLSNSQFDRAYVQDMIAGHRTAVAAFTEEAMSGKDSDIKAWAAKTLPTIREHLGMIEDIQKEIGSTGSTK